MANTSAVQILINLNGTNITVYNNKKNVVSLKVNRVIGDVANKFVLDLFDETAWKLETALYGSKNAPISIQYGATGDWKQGKYVTFEGIVTTYNLSFVGAATKLSIEGIVYTSTDNSGLDYWFRNETIQWVNTEIKQPSLELLKQNYPNDYETIYSNGFNDARFRALCSIDGRYYNNSNGVRGFEEINPETGDYYDDICARIEWIPAELNDGSTWTCRPIINPTNIFRRIMNTYNGENKNPTSPNRWLWNTENKASTTNNNNNNVQVSTAKREDVENIINENVKASGAVEGRRALGNTIQKDCVVFPTMPFTGNASDCIILKKGASIINYVEENAYVKITFMVGPEIKTGYVPRNVLEI